MKVKALYEYFTPDQKKQLGEDFCQRYKKFDIEIGKEYLVLGLFFSFNVDASKEVWIIYKVHSERLAYTPLSLFEILDNRPSKYWVFRREEEFYSFEPQEFIDNPYFNDDLTEGFPEVVKTFAELYKRMEKEFQEVTETEEYFY